MSNLRNIVETIQVK